MSRVKSKTTCGVPGCKDLSHADLSVELAGIRKQLNARLVTFGGESFIELYVRFPASPEMTEENTFTASARYSKKLLAQLRADRRAERERRRKVSLRSRRAQIADNLKGFKKKARRK
jgi:hypothetical protein